MVFGFTFLLAILANLLTFTLVIEKVKQVLSGFDGKEIVNVYAAAMDELDRRIRAGGLRIRAVHIHSDMDLMLVVLNNKKVLTYPISSSRHLSDATEKQRINYELIGKGVGAHWPDIDEDLSLKGFLRHEISLSINKVLGKASSY